MIAPEPVKDAYPFDNDDDAFGSINLVDGGVWDLMAATNPAFEFCYDRSALATRRYALEAVSGLYRDLMLACYLAVFF
ncbi:hypothetical protein ROLI_037740 [Roseobacter fucihabitans]|uniref:Uncharacterized protein n=1 Tax=Roseobacter fucihabitans TaxID=1537242 RepID=A0ABZ2BX74_9RHOB|nr:hypothetical protein [Roseobacter litoralis]